MVSSNDNNHFIFRLAYIADIFQQLNKANLKLQRRGRTVVDFTDTSTHSWKNLTIGSEKLKQEILLVRESCHSGWWWSECWYGIESCSTPWRVSWRICAVPSRNHQNKLGFGEISFIVPVENVTDCMKDELIDLRNKSGTKYVFEANKICGFWLKVSDDYPNVWKEALR